MYMIFDYYYIRYDNTMPDRKLTLQRLDFSSCFIVLVIPTIYEKQKMKRNNTKLIYVYL